MSKLRKEVADLRRFAVDTERRLSHAVAALAMNGQELAGVVGRVNRRQLEFLARLIAVEVALKKPSRPKPKPKPKKRRK